MIGALDEDMSGFENIVFFPYTANRQVFQTAFVNQYLIFPEAGKTAEAKSALQNFLTDKMGDVTAFSIYSQENQIQKTDPITIPYLWIFWISLSLIGLLLLCLLCGYLLLYYKRRKDEWKIRLLHGAKPMQIFWQILIEGKYHGLCFMGIGILFGIIITLILAILLHLPFTLHLPALLCTFLGVPILLIICSLAPAIYTVKILKNRI